MKSFIPKWKKKKKTCTSSDFIVKRSGLLMPDEEMFLQLKTIIITVICDIIACECHMIDRSLGGAKDVVV